MAQFDHMADLYFVNFQHDLAERELNVAAALDADLDMFSAAIGLTRTAINVHLKEEGKPTLFGTAGGIC